MARSTYIYVVVHGTTGAAVAAFTVKYECHEWLRGQCGGGKTLRVMRFRDNPEPHEWFGKEMAL